MTLRVIYLLAAVTMAVSETNAALTSYQCTIAVTFEVGGDGLPSGPHPWDGKLVGKGFSVDRVTGRIAGNPAFDTGKGESYLISPGNGDQSFVAYGETGYRRNYIEIKEFTQGTTKPFTMMNYGAVYMGTCE